MITRNVFARGAASIVLASGLLVGTAGCSFFTPQSTLEQYDPSDGVSANLGDVVVRNALGVINADGSAVSIMMTIVNTGSAAHSLNIQFESDGQKTTVTQVVGAGRSASFGTTPDEEQIVVLNPSVPAGALLPVYVQWGTTPGSQMLLQVLEATGDYALLAPAAK